MRRSARRLLALGAVVLATASAASAAPMPATEFAARGNASCRAYETALRRLPPFDDLAGAATFFARAHPHAQRFLRELRRLTPPATHAVVFARLLRLVEASNRLDGPIQLAARARDERTFAQLLSQMSDLEGPIRDAARRLALTDCLWD